MSGHDKVPWHCLLVSVLHLQKLMYGSEQVLISESLTVDSTFTALCLGKKLSIDLSFCQCFFFISSSCLLLRLIFFPRWHLLRF
jgi:hypothetical protein